MIYRNSGEVSGQPPLNFKNYSGSIQDYLIEGNTSQNGTPTPSDPVDVVGCGEKTENLLSSTLIRYEFAINSFESRIVEYPGSYMYVIPTNGREYFTLKVYNPGVTVSIIRLALYDKPVPQEETIEYFEEAVNTENPEITIYNVNNSPYLIIQIGSPYVNQYGITGVMLNTGSTALPYEPYGYKLSPIVNGTEYPIYLGYVPTTRRIRKLVLTGNENYGHSGLNTWLILGSQTLDFRGTADGVFCSHLPVVLRTDFTTNTCAWGNGQVGDLLLNIDDKNEANLKSYLSAQYAAGTPVTIWYVLATPQTTVVNEPLHKIGDYADTISKTQSNLPIPTISGQNTLTIPTTISPSNVSLTLEQKEIEKIYEGGKKEAELSGVPPISFNAIGSQLEDYLIEGNTSQNGTPSPTNPVDVVGCGEKTENLFDGEWVQGGININGNPVISSERIRAYQAVQPNTTYTFSSTKYVRLIYGYNGGERVDVIYDLGYGLSHSVTFTTQSNCTRIGIAIAASTTATGNILPSDISDVMLNTGNTSKPYEPYGYKIPITCGGVTIPIYLGQVPTTRRIKKLVLTGEEVISGVHGSSTAGVYCASMRFSNCGATDIIDYDKPMAYITYPYFVCSHLKMKKPPSSADMWYNISEGEIGANSNSTDASDQYYNRYFIFCIPGCTTIQDFQNYFAAQYAAGTPVTVWYVLATPETAVVNEPLMKIGDYADSISKTQSNLPIPITTGSNTLSIETTIQPSNITIGYNKQTEIAEVYGGIGENYPIYYMNRTIEGTSPIMFKGLGKDLKDYTILGDTSQNGIPTPEAPVEVNGVGVRTVNLLDYSTFVNDFWLNNNTGLPQPYNNGGRIATTSSIDVNNVNNVTFNFTSGVENTLFMYSLFNGSTLIERVTGLSTGTTIDVSNGDTLYLCLYRTAGLPITISDVSNAMLNLGSTVLPYEPYGYKLDISSGGRNLFDGSYTDGYIGGDTGTRYTTTSTTAKIAIVKCEPNTTYTIKKITSSNRFIIATSASYPQDSEIVNVLFNHPAETTATITTPADASYLLIYVSTNSEQATPNMMLNLGSTALPYEPYNRITTPIYFGQVPTTRRIKKLVIDGTESTWLEFNNLNLFRLPDASPDYRLQEDGAICDSLPLVMRGDLTTNTFCWSSGTIGEFIININNYNLADLKTYLNSNPITIYYVLATPEIGIVNEPLHKIGDYADTISMAQAGVTIPTVAGANTLTIDTTVQPSEVSITGNIKQVST